MNANLELTPSIYSVNITNPVELSNTIKENKLYEKLSTTKRAIKFDDKNVSLVLVNPIDSQEVPEYDFFSDERKNTLAKVYIYGFGSYGNSSTLIEQNYSIIPGQLDADFNSLAIKYRTSSLSYDQTTKTITARNLIFNKAYSISIAGTQGQKADNTSIKQKFGKNVTAGALLDQTYATKNIRAYGDTVLQAQQTVNNEDNSYSYLYDPYPFYTVVYDSKDLDPNAKMELLCGRFIVPMEKFQLTNLIYIFKYPEWLLNKRELLDSIDSAVLTTKVESPNTFTVIGGYPKFGNNPIYHYNYSNESGIWSTNQGNSSLVNYSNYTLKYNIIEQNSGL